MKRQYWLIILFLLWCLASGWWYLFGVKGVKTALEFFNPQATLVSIIEILAMLLVACLLGYAIAWCVRGEVMESQHETKDKILSDNSLLLQSNNDLKAQVEMWRSKHQHDLSISQHKTNELNMERDILQQKLAEIESSAPVQQNTLASQVQLEQLETEAGTLRYRIRQLEFQGKEYEATNIKLRQEIKALQSTHKEKSFSDHPFVKPLESDEKDDLTSIKGIGPFIEKRLNMLGIYTFKQLSELTPELVDRVGNAIEFFPGRIERENWIGQAQTFSEQRD